MADDTRPMTNDEAQDYLLSLLNALPPEERNAGRFGAAIRAIRAKAIADTKASLREDFAYNAPPAVVSRIAVWRMLGGSDNDHPWRNATTPPPGVDPVLWHLDQVGRRKSDGR